MLVAIICKDKPGALQTRLDNRSAHIEHLKSGGIVDMAGPLLDEAGEMCGSLIVLDVETMEQAQDWVASDPYGNAGLFESVTLRPWTRVIG